VERSTKELATAKNVVIGYHPTLDWLILMVYFPIIYLYFENIKYADGCTENFIISKHQFLPFQGL